MRRRVWASFQHFYHTLLRIQCLVSASWDDVNLVLVGETETRLHGQWLVWACCDATDVCLVRALGSRASPWGLAGFDVIGVAPKIVARGAAKGANRMWISSAFRRDATDVCLSRALLKRRVYMGNGWHGRAVMPLMCVFCTRL